MTESTRPLVSIVIPCRNEKAYLGGCLDALLSNTVRQIEILVVDGESEDGSAELATDYAKRDPRIKVLQNPERITPAALNIGIRAASGQFCAILGAHSEPAKDWIARNLQILAEQPSAAAVGGILETIGESFIGRCAAAVIGSRFGVGNARFRVGGEPGECDTVVFACYRREVFERYGYFDEALGTNQDDDFNTRLIARGERLYFDPSIQCRYYARTTWKKLFNQYWRYGYFKVEVFLKNRRIGSLRQVIPAFWLLFLSACLAAALVWSPARLIGVTALTAYLISGLGYTAASIPRSGSSAILFLPLAGSIHLAYGLGMWLGVIKLLGRNLGRCRPLLARLLECGLAILALSLLAPALVVLATGVLIESGSPVFFRQERIGRNGRSFILFKLRSMQTGRVGTAVTAASDSRITRLGRTLRRYKLDELPQLWNVLKGDMSLVGPRPELAKYVDLKDKSWQTVLSVAPGLTDPATLLYRDEEKILAEATDIEQFYRETVLPAKLSLSIAYLKVRSPWLDLKVIGLTAWYSLFPQRFNAAIVRRTFFSGEIIP